MNDREVMQMALEALKSVQDHRPNDETNNAITALRARLAEPVQEPITVAWRYKAMAESVVWSLSDDGYYISCKRDKGYIVEPLYTHPPASRPLTEEEIAKAKAKFGATPTLPRNPQHRLRAPSNERTALREARMSDKPYSLEIEQLTADIERLRADAERYRWLRQCARATSEHWGKRWSLVIEGPAPGGNAPPASIDAAIDAAREAK